MNVSAAASVPFQTVAKGTSSGFEDALTGVYRTAEDFAALWQTHGSNSYPAPDVPVVDFGTKMVAVVFTGTKMSGGYDVEVTSVDSQEEDGGNSRLVVNFATTDPPPGSVNTMALTQPYHMVSLDASGGEVAFEGSVRTLPPPPAPTQFTFMLGFEKGADTDAIIAQIRAHPAMPNSEVKGTSYKYALVHVDSESTDKDEAMKFLQDLEGVKYVEEDQPMSL